jgi:UDP-glucuronate 4-epimerase
MRLNFRAVRNSAHHHPDLLPTYGPQGGAPADRFEMMLAGKPIRLHPDAPNNYNPIYEDDYVELGIRAMEVAASPPSS